MRSTGAAVTIFSQLDYWAWGEARFASPGRTHYQPPRVQAPRWMSISQSKSSFDLDRREARVNTWIRTTPWVSGESTALLHAIFPRYPDLPGMKAARK